MSLAFIDVIPSTMDPVLAAVDCAPLVELTDRERALLDEADARPVQWIAHADFAAALRPRDAR